MMKITKLAFAFIFLISVASFQSCENEPLDSDLTSGVSDDDGGSDGGNTDDTGAASTGDYWPRAVGNFWNFNDTFYGGVTYDMVGTEVIDGDTYYKFDDLLNSESWLLKSGDSYYIRTAVGGYDIPGYAITTSYITTKMLVDSAEAGDEWTSHVSYTISYTATDSNYPEIPNVDYGATYNFEMIARDLTRTVEGVEYDNVLQVRLELEALGAPTTTVDYFYAKDVGLIEFVGDLSSGTLASYSLN
ncbi:hypothetical protein [Winogradskyella rapida]|uniref:Uncharacterized protein n=1 Tax=Winogradskyella rapida TaxID=549701 RepID=A0ABW3KPH5_9FLAO